MKKALILTIIFLSSLCAFPQDQDMVPYISLKPVEFHEELSIVNNPLIVDVREPFEYRGSRLTGAINVPSRDALNKMADTIDRATYIFVYCTTDVRSKPAAKALSEKGFIHIYSLDGGIAGWRREGFPVERKKARRRSQKPVS
jgi:rhodanese-related sulfurtransferase